jgi:cytochrome c oxidase subunit 3
MPAEPKVAVQFDTLDQQQHAVRLGMWLFLASEVLLFAGFFALYAAYRAMYRADFVAAAALNDRALGSLNTVVLITSSFTVAMGIHAVRVGRVRIAALLIWATVGLGCVFLVVKGMEYGGHFHEGLYPGSYYSYEHVQTFGAKMFFTLYFMMTGLHATHVIGGMAVLAYLAVRTRRGAYGPRHNLPLELGGLYWHLVDLIWIFLWPLLYLIR